MNAYGFNSGFRREEGLSVDGFNHPAGTNEDGWLALKLREKGYGKLFYVKALLALLYGLPTDVYKLMVVCGRERSKESKDW